MIEDDGCVASVHDSIAASIIENRNGGIAIKGLQTFLDAVSDLTVGVRPGSDSPGPIWCIEFFSAAALPLHSNTIYLLTEAELPELVRHAPLSSSVYFVASDSDDPPELPPEMPDAVTVIFVRGPLLPIHSRLNQALEVLRLRCRVDDIILMAENANYTPERLVSALSQILNVGIFILNSSYQRISGTATEFSGNPYAEELTRTGALSAANVLNISSGAEPTAMLYESASGKWSRFNVLLLWREGMRGDPQYLCRRLADFIIAYRSKNAPPDVPPFLIDRRLNRILEGKAADEAEIRSFFEAGNAPVWYSVLTLGAEPGVRWNAEAYKKQAHLLYAAFRSITVTVVRGQLAAVVRMPVLQPKDMVFSRSFFNERAYADGWDPARLEQELEQCGVYLCCSTIFQTYRLFPVEYQLISDTLDIAIKLDGCLGRRIVDFHIYSSYVLVKYAVERFIQKNEPRNIRSILNPDLITLVMHDFKNHTDLLEVLYRYYTYSDVNLTAQSLFVHRNTVYNKLKTIQKLLNVDLDDYAVRSSLYPSLQVYYYCEKCLGMDVYTPE